MMTRLTSFSEHYSWDSWEIEVVIEFDHGRYPGHVIVVYTSLGAGWVCRADVGNNSIDTSSVVYRSVVTSNLPDELPTFLLVNDDELLRIDL